VNLSLPRSLGLLAAVCWGVVAGGVVEPVLVSKSGPWGQLESRTVYLEPPENLLAVVAKPSKVTRWSFDQTTPNAVRETLAKAKCLRRSSSAS